MRFLLFLFVFAQLPSLASVEMKNFIQDSSKKEKVHLNAFVGTGPTFYNGVNSQIFLDLGLPFNVALKARYGSWNVGAFGQAFQTMPDGLLYAKVKSTGMFVGAGYYGRKFSIGLGAGPAVIFSTEYFMGGPISASMIYVPASHEYYNEFGYCGNVFMSFNDLTEWLRVSLQYSIVRTYNMKITNLLLVGLEFGRR